MINKLFLTQKRDCRFRYEQCETPSAVREIIVKIVKNVRNEKNYGLEIMFHVIGLIKDVL